MKVKQSETIGEVIERNAKQHWIHKIIEMDVKQDCDEVVQERSFFCAAPSGGIALWRRDVQIAARRPPLRRRTSTGASIAGSPLLQGFTRPTLEKAQIL